MNRATVEDRHNPPSLIIIDEALLALSHEMFQRKIKDRLFDLGLAPVELSFTGASNKDDLKRIRELRSLHGKTWPVHSGEIGAMRIIDCCQKLV